MTGSLRWLVRGLLVQRLYHQPLTAILDGLVEKRLDVVDAIRVAVFGKVEAARDFREGRVQQQPPGTERLLHQRLPAQIEQVKRKDCNLHFHACHRHILGGELAKNLLCACGWRGSGREAVSAQSRSMPPPRNRARTT